MTIPSTRSERWLPPCAPRGEGPPAGSCRDGAGGGGEVAGLVGEIRYWFSRPQEGVRYNKTVRHYLLRPIGGDPSLHDHEFDEVRWVSVPEALKLLTYENEARMLRQAVEMAGDQGEEETAGPP